MTNAQRNKYTLGKPTAGKPAPVVARGARSTAALQKKLVQLEYLSDADNNEQGGLWGQATQDALNDFEVDWNLPPTPQMKGFGGLDIVVSSSDVWNALEKAIQEGKK